jgi:lysophospholipase L1-like esterase
VGAAVAPLPVRAETPIVPVVAESPADPAADNPADPATDNPADPGTDDPADPAEGTPGEEAPADPGPAPAPVVPSPAPVVTRPAPARKPIRVLPLGDSLTWGKGSTDHLGYRAHLHRALTAAGLDVDFVGTQHNGTGADTDHEGHPGWRINQIHARLGPWLRAADPDVVLLDIGTNDYVQRHDVARAPARLAALVDQIKVLAPDAHIVLAKLLVIDGERRAAGVRQLNAAIPRIAAARRSRVTVADMSRIPVANTVDGVHPTNAGYRQMAYQWLQALRTVLPAGRAWPRTADPFPLPAITTSAVRRDAAVTVTARLTGRLTEVDLGNVTVRLRFRRAGTHAWTGLGTTRTDAHGTARFLRRITAAGDFTVVVVSGRAAGRSGTAVRVRRSA